MPNAKDWGDLTYQVMMIEYEVTVLEQWSFRMGQEYHEKLHAVFIPMEHFYVWRSFQQRCNLQNEFIQQLMTKRFKEGIKCSAGTVASRPTSRTTVRA